MTKIIDLSVAPESVVFVKHGGWGHLDAPKLRNDLLLLRGVTKVEPSAGEGVYVHYDRNQISENDLEALIREEAKRIMPR